MNRKKKELTWNLSSPTCVAAIHASAVSLTEAHTHSHPHIHSHAHPKHTTTTTQKFTVVVVMALQCVYRMKWLAGWLVQAFNLTARKRNAFHYNSSRFFFAALLPLFVYHLKSFVFSHLCYNCSIHNCVKVYQIRFSIFFSLPLCFFAVFSREKSERASERAWMTQFIEIVAM